MAVRTRRQALSRVQQKNFRVLRRLDEEMRRLSQGLVRVRQGRHAAILRILAEIERDPEIYSHLKKSRKEEGQPASSEPMTAELVQKFRARYEKEFAEATAIGVAGPGCKKHCDEKPDCICLFGTRLICCYLCASPKVIQCEF